MRFLIFEDIFINIVPISLNKMATYFHFPIVQLQILLICTSALLFLASLYMFIIKTDCIEIKSEFKNNPEIKYGAIQTAPYRMKYGDLTTG